MASGKVLEETYRKWVQYKEDCVKTIENEPLLQGNFIHFVLSHHVNRDLVRGGKGKRKRKM